MINIGWAAKHLLIATKVLPEPCRRLRTAVCLMKAGDLMGPGLGKMSLLEGHHSDGGWRDVEETVWALAFHDITTSWTQFSASLRDDGIAWLRNERTNKGAWGRSSRDLPRIPVTSWVITLLPELADEKCTEWLETEWIKDVSAETKLTYKGALTLKAFASLGVKYKNPDLISKTVDYLIKEQNEDGGFGPWKGHPVGSEPWSTGIALIGLTAWPELLRPETVELALSWLARVQLPNGLWPCHYIEEGSAYCYWGAVEGMKYLKRIGR